MAFVWDEKKDLSNQRKHGISFETAARVFADPDAVSYVDRIVDGEGCWHTIGLAGAIAISYWLCIPSRGKMKRKSGSSPRERRLPASAIFISPLSEVSRRELLRLAQLPDSKIDLSDTPETATLPSKIEIGRFYRPVKELISLRVDADVLAWFRERGPRYQTYMNEVLRREAEAQALSEIKTQLDRGAAQLKRGDLLDGEAVFAELKESIANRRSVGKRSATRRSVVRSATSPRRAT